MSCLKPQRPSQVLHQIIASIASDDLYASGLIQLYIDLTVPEICFEILKLTLLYHKSENMNLNKEVIFYLFASSLDRNRVKYFESKYCFEI